MECLTITKGTHPQDSLVFHVIRSLQKYENEILQKQEYPERRIHGNDMSGVVTKTREGKNSRIYLFPMV